MEVKLEMDDVELKAKDVLLLLEGHERECNLRYTAINEKLESQKGTLDKLDGRMWLIGILVVAAPFGMLFVERLL